MEFDIQVKDNGFFIWLLQTFGKRKAESRYWWRLFGFNVRQIFTGAEPVNMMDTVKRGRK